MCYSIKCRTSRREGYYKAGPALEGTACGEGKWCRSVFKDVNMNCSPVKKMYLYLDTTFFIKTQLVINLFAQRSPKNGF